ncbi:MAG: histidine ammonia-lyase [Methanomassiliicoccales archaeon]
MAGHRELLLDGKSLDIRQMEEVAVGGRRVGIDEDAHRRILLSRKALEKRLSDGKAIYGVNTGFGDLQDRRIDARDLILLQRNLIRSTAAGIGGTLDTAETRAMMLLRLNTLIRGHSGIREETALLLQEMLNRGVHPLIPSTGSVGASGDLAPLAHLALVLIGEGEAEIAGKRMGGAEALHGAGLSPLNLTEKEGLALINGTQFMTAVGALALSSLERLMEQWMLIFSISLQALGGSLSPFDRRVTEVRHHPGSDRAAAAVRENCAGWNGGEGRIQDAYTLRCFPQVAGPLLEMMDYGRTVLEREMNSTTDNPLVFEDGDIISAGNFHGQPVAVALDALCIPLHAFCSFSERRIARLLDSKLSGLPAFLADRPGIESGYMVAQYTAASLVGEGNVLVHPATSHSVPTSANQEDFVSMGAHAAMKLKRLVENAYYVCAIEALCATRALELAKGRASEAVMRAISLIREEVPPRSGDAVLSTEIEKCASFLHSGGLLTHSRRSA